MQERLPMVRQIFHRIEAQLFHKLFNNPLEIEEINRFRTLSPAQRTAPAGQSKDQMRHFAGQIIPAVGKKDRPEFKQPQIAGTATRKVLGDILQDTGHQGGTHNGLLFRERIEQPNLGTTLILVGKTNSVKR